MISGVRLVDQDVVHLVHDGVVVAALHQPVQAVDHVIAQVVEAELVVRAVGDVRLVGFAPLDRLQELEACVVAAPLRVEAERVHGIRLAPALDHGGGQPQKVIDRPHLLQAELGQVIVRRHEVHAAPRQRVQVQRQGGDQRFTFAGLHLRDLALVQHDPADKLHVEVAQADGPHGCLAHQRKGFRQDVVERFAFLEPSAELVRLGPQLGVAARLHLRLQRVDLLHRLAVFVQFALVGVAEHGFCQ